MKQVLLLALLSLFAIACDKKSPSQPQLPPATQTLANTAGCYINGKLFETHTEGFWSGSYVNHQRVNHGADSAIHISMSCANPQKMFFIIMKYNLWNRDFVIGYDDPFVVTFFDYTGSTASTGLNTFKSDATHQFYVHLTNYYPTGLCCGTFHGTLVNDNGQEVKITEGRFDIAYQ
ncbi:MAG: hypothetical protein JNJ58_09955 [Chitinophagaceae bacterium]|nr:hypothetical protein [Chitinophagaceae bacterium]